MEANLTNISAKFQLFPHMASEEMILLFVCFLCGNSEVWIKIICLAEDYSSDISVKLLSKYLQ